MARIETLNTYLGVGQVDFLRNAQAQMRPNRRFAIPSEMAQGPLLTVRVEHGRWLVDCPFCNSANLADDDEPRFFCLDCRNEDAGGLWLPVQWPRERKEIEDALLERKHTVNRNWLPHESVIDLLAQTLERERD